MCGIAGLVGRGGPDAVRAMTDALAHRGPDGDGFLSDDALGVHLGHRRLAVIDIGGGDQPMQDAEGQVAVTFNGEIYNHRALRRELEAVGHRFRSDHSDTEVLVHGWKQWGPNLLPRLDGMFAIALLDRRKGRLVLARDRFGKKPLYFAAREGLFAFASEARALFAHPELEPHWDATGLMKLFAYGFCPAPRTPYAGVSKLEPATWMEVDLATGRLARARWWRFELDPDPALARDPQGAAEELRGLLDAAVERRMEADVPLGFLLSGGIDSSAVVRLAAGHRDPATMQTFAVGFDDDRYDESAVARDVARRIGTNHHEETCRVDELEILMPEVLGRLDEPFADSSILPTFQVCRHARRHVTVALAGDGGDELFAGYAPFKALAGAERFVRLPEGARALALQLARMLPKSDGYMSLDFKLTRTLNGLRFPPRLWNPVWLGPLDPEGIAELFHTEVAVEELYSEAIAAWEQTAGGLVDRTLMFYTRLYLTDDILMKADRASMMHGLELRAPFLDPELAAFAARVPAELKYRNGTTKWLLKEALKPVLPKEVLHRRKQGFAVPLAGWLRRMDPRSTGHAVPGLDESVLARLWDDHRTRKADARLPLWCWIALRHGPVG